MPSGPRDRSYSDDRSPRHRHEYSRRDDHHHRRDHHHTHHHHRHRSSSSSSRSGSRSRDRSDHSRSRDRHHDRDRDRHRHSGRDHSHHGSTERRHSHGHSHNYDRDRNHSRSTSRPIQSVPSPRRGIKPDTASHTQNHGSAGSLVSIFNRPTPSFATTKQVVPGTRPGANVVTTVSPSSAVPVHPFFTKMPQAKTAGKGATRGLKPTRKPKVDAGNSSDSDEGIGALHLLFTKDKKKTKKKKIATKKKTSTTASKTAQKRQPPATGDGQSPAPVAKKAKIKKEKKTKKDKKSQSAKSGIKKSPTAKSRAKKSKGSTAAAVSSTVSAPPPLVCKLCCEAKPPKALVAMQPHAVLQGPPNTTKRGKKVPNKKGDEEDEEDDVEIVELKTKFLVCSRCNFRVHWRCYESPFIKKPLEEWVCRWCAYVDAQQHPEPEQPAGDAEDKPRTPQPTSPPKTEKQIEKEWLAAWPTEEPSDEQRAWSRSRYYFEACCVVEFLNEVESLEFPELTFADLPAMVRDPTDNKLLEDVVTQVLKVVSERTVRKTGPSTWLPVWLHELEEFPDEYNADEVLDKLDEAESNGGGSAEDASPSDVTKLSDTKTDEAWLESEEDSDDSDEGPVKKKRSVKPVELDDPESSPPNELPWFYRLSPEMRLQVLVETVNVFLAHKSSKARDAVKEISTDLLRRQPAGTARNGDLFWLCQTEGEVRLLRETIVSDSTAVGGQRSSVAMVVWTPDGLRTLCKHVEHSPHPGEIKLFNSLNAIVADLLAREQKAARARARRETQRRNQELSMLYAMQWGTRSRRSTRSQNVDYSGRSYDAQFRGLI